MYLFQIYDQCRFFFPPPLCIMAPRMILESRTALQQEKQKCAVSAEHLNQLITFWMLIVEAFKVCNITGVNASAGKRSWGYAVSASYVWG